MTDGYGPLGRVLRTEQGARLEFRRDYLVPVDDLWSAVTEPERLARWIGSWTGRAEVGGTVDFQMLHEERECAPDPVTIVECDPPTRLAVEFPSPEAAWLVELTLSATPTGSTLLFSQRLNRPEEAGDAGPGWHWYLDRLGAVLGDTAMPAEWARFYTDELRAAYRTA